MTNLYYQVGEHIMLESGMATIDEWNGHIARLTIEDYEGNTEERFLTRSEIAEEIHALDGKERYKVFIEKGGN